MLNVLSNEKNKKMFMTTYYFALCHNEFANLRFNSGKAMSRALHCKSRHNKLFSTHIFRHIMKCI